MSLTSRPPDGASLACDLCGQSRVWACWNSKTGAVICQTCVKAKGNPQFSGLKGTHGYWLPPSDSSNHQGVMKPDHLRALFDS